MRCDWFRISPVPAKITSKFSPSLSLSTDMTNSGGKLMYLFSEGRLKQWSINLLTCKFSKTHKMVRFNVRKYSKFDLNRFYLLFYLLFIYEKMTCYILNENVTWLFWFAVAIEYSRIGCYRDTLVKPRPLPELIENFRGGRVDWNNLNNTIAACAEAAKKKGYLYFGLQFYGECWSGPQAQLTYARDGPSKNCSKGVGEERANFVYKIKLLEKGERLSKRIYQNFLI